MTDIVLFGGTTEGKELCVFLGEKHINTLVCVATEYGEALLSPSYSLRVRTGRLGKEAIENLLKEEKPRLVIDATHPYATEVSENIFAACEKEGVRRLRLIREESDTGGCECFWDMEELIGWLNKRPGIIFSSLGLKEANALTSVEGYRERIWLRVLPDAAGLKTCLEAGFPANHIICMQGPFSKELNSAMFRAAGADILLTKESGPEGGFREKAEAAKECKMTVAVLKRPREETGMTLAALKKLIEEEAP